jgi:predicted DNA-binding transcriptional regulator AlpA
MPPFKLESLIDKFISGPELRRRCGGVSDMTIWRWQHDPTLAFPKPLKIRRRNYFKEREVIAWLAAHAPSGLEAP